MPLPPVELEKEIPFPEEQALVTYSTNEERVEKDVEEERIEILPVAEDIPISPRERSAQEKPADNEKAIEKRKTPSEPYIDKKGFRVITDQHNLLDIFGVEKPKKEKENFGKMYEKSQTDAYQLRLLADKIRMEKEKPFRPPTEKIKVYPPPQLDLDLHGYTAAEADNATELFIRNARLKGILTLRIIVGKGLHSQGKAVLPDLIERRIIELKKLDWVLGFSWEKKDKRKSGALIIYLTPIV